MCVLDVSAQSLAAGWPGIVHITRNFCDGWFDGCGGDDPHGNFFFDLDLQIRLKLSGSAKSNKEKEIRVSLKAPNPLISSHKV